MTTDFLGTGWAFPLAFEPSGAVAVTRGEDRIEQAMRLILATYPGERPMRPQWGCTLRDHVFGGTGPENIAAITHCVRTALEKWEPRAAVAEVLVTPRPEQEGLLHLDIRYTVRGVNSPRNLVFPFYTIPEHEEVDD